MLSLSGAQEVLPAPGADGVVPTPAGIIGTGFSVIVKSVGALEVLPAPGADGGVSTHAARCSVLFLRWYVKFTGAQEVLPAPGTDGGASTTPAGRCGAAFAGGC